MWNATKLWVLGCGLIALITGCGQVNEMEHVEMPKSFSLEDQSIKIEGDYRIRASFTFNESVDRSTVALGETVFIYSRNSNLELDGKIYWENDQSFFFLSENDIMQICGNGEASCDFDLVLIGEDRGTGAIKNQKGQVLDGNGNNQPGGDFLASLDN